MNQRFEITLSQETINKIMALSTRENLSNFIDQAVNFYIKEINANYLKEQLKEGAIKRRERDLEIAESWFELEEEAIKLS